MKTREILDKVARSEITVDDALTKIGESTFVDFGHAKIDTQREARTGFPEVVFCEGKTDEHLVNIYKQMLDADGHAFGTRASAHQAEAVKAVVPNAHYDEISKVLYAGEYRKEKKGLVVVCTAGTADIAVAEEAAGTAEYFGCNVERVYDIGVSGLHRLLAHVDVLRQANCVITVAGMEGALVSVVGGLVKNPVIAVPTSVGYGASLNGVSALLTMINTCANGIATVNIDNGYGAGYLATQINRLAVERSLEK